MPLLRLYDSGSAILSVVWQSHTQQPWFRHREGRRGDQQNSDFERGKTDILVGTQMISKGLDFEKVRVVGILSADSMLHYPDFRAHERAFQLISQVGGRAGRHGKRGLVVLQTSGRMRYLPPSSRSRRATVYLPSLARNHSR